jgi:hypothetical protein
MLNLLENFLQNLPGHCTQGGVDGTGKLRMYGRRPESAYQAFRLRAL